MGNATLVQNSFAGGEFSPYAQGRFDLPTYRKALNVCLNGFPIETEALTRRPGTLFAGPSLGGASAVVRSFDFAAATPYTMEFAAGLLSFRQGAARVTGNDAQVIASISTAKPAVVATALAHGWATNAYVFFSNLGANNPLLQNRLFQITVIDTSHFSIADALTGAAIDGSTLGAFVSGTVQSPKTLATPYLATDLQNIRVVQTEAAPNATPSALTQVAYIFCKGYPPYALIMQTAPSGSAFATFTLNRCSNTDTYGFQDGPYLDPTLPGPYLIPSGTGANGAAITLTASSGTPFTSAAVGQLVRLFNQPPEWQNGQTSHAGEIYTVYQQRAQNPAAATYWTATATTTASQVSPPLDPSHWVVAPVASASIIGWVWGIITAVNSTSQVTVTLQNGGTVLYYNYLNGLSGLSGRLYLWRLGAYGGANGAWPTCGTYHEGRLWPSGAIDNRLDGTRSNKLLPVVMSPTEVDGTVTDSCGVSYILNAPDANPIFWLEPDQQGLIVGSQGGEFLVQATTANQPLTPTSVQAHRATKVKCANVEPARCDLTLAFVQLYQRKVMEYFADVFSGKLTAPNLAEYAMHLGVNAFQEVRFQRAVNPILWARDGAGALVGATYRRTRLFSSEKPDFIGWHRHTLGSGYGVKSIAVGASTTGGLDALTLVTADPNGVNYVEVMTDAFNEAGTLTNAVFLDQATAPTSAVVAGPTPSLPQGTVTFNGLWHFNGKTVTVWASGLDCGDYPVTNGSLIIPFGDGIGGGAAGGLFSAAAWAANPVAWIGYNFVSDMQLLPPVDPREAGTQAGPALGKVQRGQQIAIKLVNTGAGGANGGVYLGGDFTRLHKAQFKTPGGSKLLTQTQMFSGTHWDILDDQYSFATMPCLRVNRPYPCTVAAMSVFLHSQDR